MLWDVTTAYRGWSDEWYQHGVLSGIDAPWVYPVLAVLPMLAAGLGQGDGYCASRLVPVGVLGLAVLIPLRLRSRAAAWWWSPSLHCSGRSLRAGSMLLHFRSPHSVSCS